MACVARRSEPEAKPPRVPELLSIVTAGPVTVSGYSFEQVQRLDDACGRYVTFRKGPVPPGHEARLIAALQRDTAAWAVASGATSVRQALLEGRVARESSIVDRERIGPFALVVPDDAPAADAVLFARLAAVFPPVFVPGPAPAPVEGVQAALEVMKARPLRMLTTLEALVSQAPPRHPIVDRLDDELEQRAPRLRRALAGCSSVAPDFWLSADLVCTAPEAGDAVSEPAANRRFLESLSSSCAVPIGKSGRAAGSRRGRRAPGRGNSAARGRASLIKSDMSASGQARPRRIAMRRARETEKGAQQVKVLPGQSPASRPVASLA